MDLNGILVQAMLDQLTIKKLGMFFFVISGLLENVRDLAVTFLVGNLGIIGVPIARLGFPGERLHKIFGRFASFKFCHTSLLMLK